VRRPARGVVALAVVLALAAAPAAARAAHVGAAPEPHDLWTAWTLEPAVLLGLAVGGWAYSRGLRTLRARTRGRPRRGVAGWRAGCYAAGLLTLAVALVSPVDAVGGALFSVHMAQHLLLVMVAAPLLVLGEPLLVTLWALPLGARRALGRWWARARRARAAWRTLRQPLVVWALHVGTLWAWHAPRLYQGALRHPAVHALEHASFFLPALLFWWLLADRRSRRRLGVGTCVVFLFTAGLQSTVLGALITVAQRPWYTAYYDTTRAWGLTPLEDQQLAGLIMWIPASAVYLAALVALFAGLTRERDDRRGVRGAASSPLGGSGSGEPHTSASRP